MAEQVKITTGTSDGPVDVVTGAESEPLRGRALYVSLATLIVSAATAWGLKLTADQTAVLIGALAFVAPQVVSLWARRHVNSPATMRKILARRT